MKTLYYFKVIKYVWHKPLLQTVERQQELREGKMKSLGGLKVGSWLPTAPPLLTDRKILK